IFIGYEWLRFHNPEIDWRAQTIKFDRCPDQCGYQARMVSPDDDEEPYDPSAHLGPGESILAVDLTPRISYHIRARSTAAQQIAEEQHKQKEQRTFEQIVPPHYHDFKDVFDKESFDELPE
ncbi:hypothetical protein FKP32DRAFT_1537725, partial [Trametes sanguinea]